MYNELEEKINNLEKRVELLEKELQLMKHPQKSPVGRPFKFTSEQRKNIYDEYCSGISIPMLKTKYNCAYNTISKIIKDNKEERDNMVIQVRKG